MTQLTFTSKFMQKFAAFQPFVLVALLATPGSATAAPAPDTRLDTIFEYYQSLKGFRAEFHQTKRLTAEDLELKSTGSLSVSFGQALLWDVRAPARLSVFLSSQILEIRAGEGAKQTKNRYDLQSSAASEKMIDSLKELTALLSMNKAEVAKQYSLNADGKELTLTPKVPRQFASVQIVPDASGHWIDRMNINEVSGDTLVLDFDAPVRTDSQWINAWKAVP